MNLKPLLKLSINEILNSYAFPHRFYVKFSVIAADKAMSYIKEKCRDLKSIRALELARRFNLGEEIDKEALRAAANAAYADANAAANAAYAAYAAAYAANAAANAYTAAAYTAAANAANAAYAAAYDAAHYAAHSVAANAAAYASYAAAYTANAACMKYLKEELITLIKTEFTETELILMKAD